MSCILYSLRQVRASFIVLLLSGCLISHSVSANSPDTNASTNNDIISDMTIGDASAPVSIIEYASFTCSHCATFHNLVFDKVKSKYVDSGKAKFTFREVYFDKFGLAGSLIARCEQNSEFFFKYSGQLFEQQRAWMKTKNEAELLTYFQNIAKEQGMSEETFSSCLNNNINADQLLNWYQTNAERDEIKSTPAFLINGKKYSNMSFEAMAEIIESELAKPAR
ncbi:DsbA family protein [Alteromonas gracilis]|uniref:DsbA family protein n=1 Tax=Alteromonas gracilis TaxID=1479524 RepID=UPI002FE12E46